MSELEAMLTALIGPEGPYGVEDIGKEWRWTRTRAIGLFHITLGQTDPLIKNPIEALQAINQRLAQLAPKGWRIELEYLHESYWLSWIKGPPLANPRPIDIPRPIGSFREVKSNLGALVTLALEAIAQHESSVN